MPARRGDFRLGPSWGILDRMRHVRTPLLPLALVVAMTAPLAACSSGDDSEASHSSSPSSSSSESVAPTSSSADTGADALAAAPEPARGRVEVVRTLDHDPSLFTQGLEVHDGTIYESTGMWGTSQVQHRPLEGEGPVVSVPLPAEQFGEGMTVEGDTAWSLTWKDGIAYSRDRETLEQRSTVRYEGEGWGLCSDGTRLVMSDGSDTLTFRDLNDFRVIGTIKVTSGGKPVRELNELDCTGGTVLANVWNTNDIVRIDPVTGRVSTVYDASALEQPRPSDPNAVLNGIASIPGTDHTLLTGKLWPHMYEVRLVD